MSFHINGFEQAMKNMLPNTFLGNYPAVTTGRDGIRQDINAPRTGRCHGGVDVNYQGPNRSELNSSQPPVGAPISGKIVKIDPNWGRVDIEDANGFVHQVRHMASISNTLQEGQTVVNAGQNIGAMGGQGPSGPTEFPPHVDYKIKDPYGRYLDPEKWWNGDFAGNNCLNPIPAYLDPRPYQDAMSLFQIPRRDPLIFDLDGNGIQTLGVNNGAFFDHDGDGFAEATGWVAPGDGLLVWDRNADGIINDGRELFGDQTLLSDGTLAGNGFQVLVEHDDNGDGKIDVSDSIWMQLRVWQVGSFEDGDDREATAHGKRVKAEADKIEG